MNVAAGVLVGLVAALQLVFLVLEMLLWTTPTGRGVLGLDGDFARRSRAAHQGLYDGFLVAGGYGAATVNKRILLVQALPAAVALAAVALS